MTFHVVRWPHPEATLLSRKALDTIDEHALLYIFVYHNLWTDAFLLEPHVSELHVVVFIRQTNVSPIISLMKTHVLNNGLSLGIIPSTHETVVSLIAL